jgi:TolA-binding protein
MQNVLKKDPQVAAALSGTYPSTVIQAIHSYLDDFEVFADGFMPIVPTVAENSGVRLLLVKCNIALEYLGLPHNATTSPVVLGVLFIPQFPQRPPVFALMLDRQSGWELPTLPWLASNGSIKVNALPSVNDVSHPPLIDVLLAVTSELGVHRLERRATTNLPVPVSPPLSSSMAHSPHNVSSAPPPPSSVPPSAASLSWATTPPPSSAASPMNRSQAAPDVLSSLQAAVDKALADFIVQRELAERRLSELRESEATQTKLASSLADRQRVLTQALQMLQTTERNLTEAVALDVQKDDPMNALQAPDSLRKQAAELLSEVLALDDLLSHYEKRLKRETIPSNTYLRLVGDASRQQFIAKYRLKKVHGMATARQSFTSLIQRFPQIDQTDIAAVLAECRYSHAEAARHLSEMAGALR